MISRSVPRRMWRPPMIIYPIPVDWFPARPAAQGRQVSPLPRLSRQGKRLAPRAVAASRANLPAGVLIIFVVTTAVAEADMKRLVIEGASA
jgi:hypothetical protein